MSYYAYAFIASPQLICIDESMRAQRLKLGLRPIKFFRQGTEDGAKMVAGRVDT